MKRGRISVAVNREKNETELSEFSHTLINSSGPSFSDFPRDIVVNVLLRLSIKRIFVCKLVCKTWRDLISAPEFAMLHFDQAQACPLIQISRNEVLSRMLYLVQPEMEDFKLKLEMCGHKPKSDSCVKFELDTRFKLPLRNLQMMLDDESRCHDMLESNYCNILRMKDHQYRIVNSCNGLLCLSNRSNYEPLVVCNPVTGEFINLPTVNWVSKCHYYVHYGFGFSPAANKYKVIRMIQPRDPISTYLADNCIRAEVHTLGTGTWKGIEGSAKALYGLGPTYLKGFLYWAYVPYGELHLCLMSFDIGNECFGSISAPPIEFPIQSNAVYLGVLGEELSISCLLPSGMTEIWVMKNYGTTNVWSKVFSDLLNFDEINRNYIILLPCKPIKCLNDGALLMFDSNTSSLIYKHPRKLGFRYFKLRGTKARMYVISHVPSFVSLKEALSGNNVKVLNVNSRCGNLKVQYEDKRIFMVEKVLGEGQ